MKRKYFSFAIFFSAVAIWSCNNSGSATSSTSDSGSSSTTTTTPTNPSNSDTSQNASKNQANSNNTNMSSKPLSKADSSFIMEAATGGMMEVQGGTIAQQNASNQRVKDFGSMMVTDHSQANDELKSFASGRGITIPATLPASKQKMLDQMKNMKGKSFDSHYVSMMTNDHKEDIGKFKKESTSANDPDLRAWVTKTLPTLQKHLDSIQAIKKAM